MCGIAGFFDQMAHRTEEEAIRVLGTMIDRLAHRGPDDRGLWVDASAGIGLGHRRLSIIDVSSAGHQPMIASLGRYVISYNGEIFNWEELRAELPPPEGGYRGHSDTEIFLRGCEIWGIRATIDRLIGFFALALWDRETRQLWLVRDRLGIKPLYWAMVGPKLIFGSELSALRAHPVCPSEIDRASLTAYMRFAAVPAPRSIYAGVHKLQPGMILELGQAGPPRLTRYWDVADAIRAGASDRARPFDRDRLGQWEELLFDSVRRRMVADVPLGAFLSGGIDSSVIVALMQRAAQRPVKTYSVGFHENGYDEAPFARKVAQHLGTDHTEYYVGASEALEIVPKLAAIYDEPFADSSQIPTALICQLARRDVTVALSGDGGDEIFGGYNRYLLAERLWPRLKLMPRPVRQWAAALIRTASPGLWDYLLQPVAPSGMGQIGDKLHKLALVLGVRDVDQLYRRLVSQWKDPGSLVLGGVEPDFLDVDLPTDLAPMERLQAADLLTYLPNDILTKVDRASMAVALEVRVPFLDHRIVEQSWHLPRQAKIDGGTAKFLLREIAYKHVPKTLLDRPKMGFGVPIDHWLRGPLKAWASELLDPARIEQQGLLNSPVIQKAWDEHQSGRHNHQYALWTVLMFQAWRERNP